MKPKVSHGGAGVTIAEYEVRELNLHGDVINVSHWKNKRSAMKFAIKCINQGVLAAVVELHMSRYPAHLFSEPDKFKRIASLGSPVALSAGGWI